MHTTTPRPRTGRIWLGGGSVAVVVVVVLALFGWPGPVAGRPAPVPAGTLSRLALDALGELSDLRLRGTIETDAGTDLAVDIVSLAAGTTATVSDGLGGQAEFVAADDRVVVNANRAWWLNTVPVYAQGLSGKWVQANENMGFPIGMLIELSGERLAERITESAGSAPWSARPTARPDGTPALALTPNDSPWTIHVATQGEPRLLGLDGPLATTGDRLRRAQGGSYPIAQVSTSRADDPCRQRTNDRLTDAREQTTTAPEPPPMPEPNHGPSLNVTVTPTGVCMSPMCPTPVVVANTGDEPATGMVSVTSSSGGGGTQPFSVPAGGQATATFQVVNPANTCTRTCTRQYQVTAFAQITSIAGPDLGAGKRLHDKGIDPNRPVPASPEIAGPDVNRIIDGLTSTPGITGFTGFTGNGLRADAVEDILELVKDAKDSRLISVLRTLVDHLGTIKAPASGTHPVVTLARAVRSGTPDEKLAATQTIGLLAELAAQPGRPKGTLTAERGLISDAHTKRLYSVEAVAADRPPTPPEPRVYDAVERALDRFDDGGPSTQEYHRVLVLEFDRAVPKYGSAGRAGLGRRLNVANANGDLLRDLLRDGSGALRVNEILVANQATRDRAPGGRYLYTADDIEALAHQREARRPTTKPRAGELSYTPHNERHITHGDPDDPAATQHAKAGGHLSGAGGPQRTEFPAAWTLEDIKEAVAQVVDQGRTVDLNGQPSEEPVDNFTAMGTPSWSWRYVDLATVKGIPVEIEVIVYPDGSVRTTFPTAGDNSRNQVVTREDVHDRKSTTITDRTIFKNPPSAPAKPQLDNARTGAPRYDRATDQWRYPALDARGNPIRDKAGKQVEYRTDNDGTPVPGSPLPQPAPGC